MMVVPLTLLGIGYSVYAAALWGCIPYTVPPKLIGSAFGLCTSVQNIGLTISPILAGFCLNTAKDDGYFWFQIYFCILCVIGFFINVWMYLDDLKNRGGVLHYVDNGDDNEDEPKVTDFVTSPTATQRRKAEEEVQELKAKEGGMTADEQVKAALLEYKAEKSNRDSLRRSIGVAATK